MRSPALKLATLCAAALLSACAGQFDDGSSGSGGTTPADELKVLTMGDAYERKWGSSGSSNRGFRLYSVDVPANANTPRIRIEAESWTDDSASVCVSSSIPKQANWGENRRNVDDDDGWQISPSNDMCTCFTDDGNQGKTFQALYYCDLTAGAMNYIMVDESDLYSSTGYEIKPVAAAMSGGAVVALVLVFVFIFAAVCLTLGKKSHMSAVSNEKLLVKNNYGMLFFMPIFLISPSVLIIVGASVNMSPMTPIMCSVGAAVGALLCTFIGHTTYIMDAEKQEFRVIKRRCLVIPSATTRNFDTIQRFGMVMSRSSKGNLLYSMTIFTTTGANVSMETGASNVNIAGRQAIVKELNDFLGRATGRTIEDATAGLHVTIGFGGGITTTNPVSAATVQQNANLATQNALLQSQVAMMQQQQAMQHAYMGGAVPPASAMPPASAGYPAPATAGGGPGYPMPAGYPAPATAGYATPYGAPMPPGAGGMPAAAMPPAASGMPPATSQGGMPPAAYAQRRAPPPVASMATTGKV